MIIKSILIILGVLLTLFIASQLYFMATNQQSEEYPYTVIKKYEGFEIRQYESSLFTSVQLDTGEYGQGSSKGFSVLAGYIFGGNDRKEKIAMTSPVSMSLEDSMTMMFMVPKEYNKEDLPNPDRKDIEFVQVPAKTLAAIRFSGWANDEKIEKYKKELLALLDQHKIKHTGNTYFFGYNAPYETVNRRNEVVIELMDDSKS